MPIDREMLAYNLREARQSQGLSQAALAERVGVSTETVSRFERGAYEPALSTAFDLSRALGLSLDALLAPASRPARPAKVRRPRGRPLSAREPARRPLR